MSIIENLLLNLTDTKEIKTQNGKNNFLLDLLNSLKDEPEKLTDLFKSLNINEKDIEQIQAKLSDNLDTDDTELKDLLNKIKESLKIKTEPKTADIDIKKPLSKDTKTETQDNILSKLINKPQSNEELEKKVKDLVKKTEKEPLNQNIQQISTNTLNLNITKTEPVIMEQSNQTETETKIVEVTKKIITSTKTLENLKLSDQEIKEFKSIKTFKELVDFANKKELNISKIVLNYQKEQKTPKPEKFMPKNKIEIPQSAILKQPVKKTDSKNTISNTEFKNEFKPQTDVKSTNVQKVQQNNKNIQNEDILSQLIKKSSQIQNTKNKENQTDTVSLHSNQTNTNKDTKNEDFNNIQNINQTDISQLKQNIAKAKQSVKHFATNLKEAVENYKPPVSKLSMELHPKELGKVEVTIVHRGDNLQIQINSNNTAIGFLHSQQQELRQNLINMGFTDVNMSFNQQQQQGNRQYKQNQNFQNQNEELEELIIEVPYQYA